jgi:Domain of unknown function (DUF4335)
MSVLSPTISKLYTPPTCTLEVTAKASLLSRWTRTPVIKSLQFLLSFDSSAQRAREPIEIYGDQTQLSALTETVTQYIQTILASRAADLPLSGSQVESHPPVTDAAAAELALRPHSLLTHELMLGSLATDQSGPSLLLKVSQLYDLATALEDCTAELQQMPSLIAAERPAAIMPLLRSAAVVLLTVGLGTATWRLFQTGPVAVTPSASTSKTALAPSVTPLPSTASPFPSALSRPLNLPSIQLPNRSDSSITAGAGTQTLTQTEPSSSIKRPPPLSGRSRATAKATPPQSVASLPSTELNSSAPSAGSQADAAASSSVSGSAMRSKALSQAFEAAPAPQKAAGQSTLFDTIPQVAEVRNYVASRWQPSAPLQKNLEYRVTINADGSLEAIEPLGASAQQYLNQVPLPQVSSAFVSPSGTRSNIRLLLRQDGTVQTFPDGAGQ